jgi:hypothetical protein
VPPRPASRSRPSPPQPETPASPSAAASTATPAPGQPSLHHAARQLGIRHAVLADRVRQLEDVTGITLLTTRPDGTVTLTPDGEQFARNVRPVLESLAQSRSQDASYAP